MTTYSRDTRVRSSFLPPSNWRLSISFLTKHDSGIYLCQLSSHPPRVLITSLRVDGKNHTNVFNKEVSRLHPTTGSALEIMISAHDHGDRYVNPGSAISLKCLVRRKVVGDNMWEVDWVKDGHILDIFNRKYIR